MNVFLPQSIQTQVEIEELTGVSRQIISPATSTPIISVAQDSMVGSYILTKSDFSTTGENLFHYLMSMTQLKSDFNFIRSREKEKWSGNELFSAILPNISLKNSKIEIKNGKIVSGFMDKATLGGGSKGIIQAIIHQQGVKVCRDFLDNLQRLVVAWMEDISFSIGFGDAMPKQNIREEIQTNLEETRKESDELILKAQLGLYEPFLNNEMKMAKIEIDIANIGNKATNNISGIVSKNLPIDNNFMISVDSGSKGDSENLNQIMGLLGQRKNEGKRIAYGLTGRTLPHYTMWDIGLESRGFVYNSYMNGLSPSEFFFTSMNSRGDAINSNIKTAETGYMQRRLIKAMEDLKVEYDGTIRDASKNIVQFYYGIDGYNSIKIEHVKLSLIKYNDEKMENEYQWNIEDVSEALLTKEAYDKLVSENNENNEAMLKEWNQLLKDRNDLRYKYYPILEKELESILSPFNIERLIYQMINQFHIEEYNQSDLTPIEIIEAVNELNNYLSSYNIHNNFSPILKIFIRSNLSSKQFILKHKLPKSILKHLINVIKYKILYAIVDPGEMVGVIAAQSIGEPLTQLVLKSYHFSGGLVNQSVVTNSGVPRIQEIIGFTSSKNLKTPAMKIYLKPQYSNNKEIALQVKNQLEDTKLKDLLISSEILYIPNKTKSKYEEEDEQFKIFQEIIELTESKEKCFPIESLSNWVLWMEFDREIMLRKNIYMSDIQDEISKRCDVETNIHCVVGNMNSDRLTLRIRVNQHLDEGNGYISFFRSLGDCLLDIRLRGINGIDKIITNLEKNGRIIYDSDGTMKQDSEWVLTTEGSNLIAVLSNEYVDEYRTTTNDISEIHSLFGIEGTRNAIIQEISKTIEEGASKNINIRHYSVLADLMTYRGKVMPIQKNGFGKSPYIGPLGRASYEVMDKVLVSAGIFSEVDDMEGTSANVITGQSIHSGTNSFKLYMNTEMFSDKVNSQDNSENTSEYISQDTIENKFQKSNENTNNIKLEDYMNAIGTQSTYADDSDFNFGYGILTMEEYDIRSNIQQIDINVSKSDENVRNRRRRKR